MHEHKRNLFRVVRNERGAALILTVIVILVLTTVGMAMVAFTTTEEKTAMTYRDTAQTRGLAEAGVRVVQEMFRDPMNSALVPVYNAAATADDTASPKTYHFWGSGENAIETQLNQIGIWRRDRTGKSPAKYRGPNYRFFLGPFQGTWDRIFGGAYSSSNASDQFDLKLNCTDPDNPSSVVASADCWLDSQINTALLVGAGTASDWNLDPGKITDISFYAPPMVNGSAYGIATVRVTAEKYDKGNLLAREVVEALIGDGALEPSVFANGNIAMGSIDLCGDGCERIHANGNATVGSVAAGSGEPPIVTATGTAAGAGGGANAQTTGPINAPEINPWDLIYKPTTSGGLTKYYLLAARALDVEWTDNNPATFGSAPEPCGVNQLSLCQDYNLEYDMASPRVEKSPKSTSDVPAMYRFNNIGPYGEWTLCATGNSLSCGAGTPSFSVTPADDLEDVDATDGAGKVDNADMPFNRFRVAQTVFDIGGAQDGATILIDGKLTKNGNMNTTMSIITVGSIYLHAQSSWQPALENKAMFIAGRDFQTHSNCCAPSNQCGTNVSSNQDYVGITAAHEQYHAHSNHPDFGLMIIEHRINLDPEVDSDTVALQGSNQGSHGSLCYDPSWPWTMPTVPVILSLKSVPD